MLFGPWVFPCCLQKLFSCIMGNAGLDISHDTAGAHLAWLKFIEGVCWVIVYLSRATVILSWLTRWDKSRSYTHTTDLEVPLPAQSAVISLLIYRSLAPVTWIIKLKLSHWKCDFDFSSEVLESNRWKHLELILNRCKCVICAVNHHLKQSTILSWIFSS